VTGHTEKFGLNINIVGSFFIFNFLDKYSVIPKYFFFKKWVLDIGPLIKPNTCFFLSNSKATLKQLLIYFSDLFEILSNAFLKLYLTSIMLIFLLFNLALSENLIFLIF